MRPHGSTRRLHRDAPCHGLALWLAAACCAIPAHAADPPPPFGPLLRCLVRYASETLHIEARPTHAPYEIVPHDVGGRFRFKAVVAGTPGTVDHIALYAYDMAVPQAPVLIHQAVYHPPFPPNTAVPGLTGWNHVYSAYLGREMVYGCALTQEPSP